MHTSSGELDLADFLLLPEDVQNHPNMPGSHVRHVPTAGQTQLLHDINVCHIGAWSQSCLILVCRIPDANTAAKAASDANGVMKNPPDAKGAAKAASAKADMSGEGQLQLMVVPIFAALPPERQARVFKPAPVGTRKVTSHLTPMVRGTVEQSLIPPSPKPLKIHMWKSNFVYLMSCFAQAVTAHEERMSSNFGRSAISLRIAAALHTPARAVGQEQQLCMCSTVQQGIHQWQWRLYPQTP